MMERIRALWNSLWLKITVSVMVSVLVLICFLAYSIRSAVDAVSSEVAKARKSMVAIYMEQVDSTLKAAESYLATDLSIFNNEIKNMQFLNSPDQRQLARCGLLNEISDYIVQHSEQHSVFVYPRYRGSMLQSFSSATSYEHRKALRAYTSKLLEGLPKSEGRRKTWSFHRVDGRDVLLLLLDTEEAFLGIYFDVDKLVISLQHLAEGQETQPLIVSQGRVLGSAAEQVDSSVDLGRGFADYYVSGAPKEYLVVGSDSSVASFSFAVLLEYRTILEALPSLQTMGNLLLVLSVLFAVFLWLYLRRVLNTPLRELSWAMNQISSGDMNTRLRETPYTSREFREIQKAFNKMMDCIGELKIGMYEEQLTRQRVELDYLQLQISPHFFLNTINLIYGFSQTKNYEAIQELTLYLTRYLRYFFRMDGELVRLEEELRHVKNYLEIARIRYGDTLEYEEHCPSLLSGALVPHLCVHTFVENSLKYAFSHEEGLQVCVEASFVTEGEFPYLQIEITDSGKGFSRRVLEELQAGRPVVDKSGSHHIGIWNIRQRLALLYQGGGELRLRNAEQGGAQVVLKIPYRVSAELGKKEEQAQ